MFQQIIDTKVSINDNVSSSIKPHKKEEKSKKDNVFSSRLNKNLILI